MSDIDDYFDEVRKFAYNLRNACTPKVLDDQLALINRLEIACLRITRDKLEAQIELEMKKR